MIKACWRIFSEYADSCTVHGVKYLAEPKRPFWEKIFWVIAFIFAIFGCTRLILNILNKWQRSPVIVSFADKATPIWQIPFPAVTICPQTKTISEKFNFSKLILDDPFELTDYESDRLAIILQTCNLNEIYDRDLIKSQLNITDKAEFIDGTHVKFLEKLKPLFNKTVLHCAISNNAGECDDFFSQILTDAGLCYTFNNLHLEELYRTNKIQKGYNYMDKGRYSNNWTLEDGYSEEIQFDLGSSYPIRVMSTYKRDSLLIKLASDTKDFEYICGQLQGFKILFHSPSELPQFSKKFYHILLDKQVHFSLNPKVVKTDDDLRSYNSKIRQCHFNKDKYLKYFKIYTEQNCELECLTNYTLKRCNCVKYYMPSDPNTHICGTSSIICAKEAAFELSKSHQKALFDDVATECNCLPACTSIDYVPEIMQYDLEQSFSPSKYSYITIAFKDVEFIATKRSRLYNFADLLANLGGLLGLFMGISILSMFEKFYFWTIRVISDMWKKRKNISNNIHDELENVELKSKNLSENKED